MFRNSLIKIAILISYIFVMQNVSAKEKKLTIGLIGDSTVADTYGWGPGFSAHSYDQVNVLNYARNGATLDSLSNELDALIAMQPNYILIQFGHNDMHHYDTKTYSKKLTAYVERITRGGSKAIVLSSVSRRNFDENGKIRPRIINGNRSLPIYAKSAEAVAQATKVPFIDLNSISMQHHNKIGPKASATYNYAGTDITHFSEKGAAAIADLIIKELKTVVPKLGIYLK